MVATTPRPAARAVTYAPTGRARQAVRLLIGQWKTIPSMAMPITKDAGTRIKCLQGGQGLARSVTRLGRGNQSPRKSKEAITNSSKAPMHKVNQNQTVLLS